MKRQTENPSHGAMIRGKLDPRSYKRGELRYTIIWQSEMIQGVIVSGKKLYLRKSLLAKGSGGAYGSFVHRCAKEC